MSKRATVVLAVVVLALLAYILKFERSSLTSKELDQRSGKVLTSFVRDKLDRLEIQRKGKRVIVERKPGSEGGFGSWQMLEPWKGEADESEVDQVLGELEWLDARRTLGDVSAKDRVQFGLDKPRYRVTFRAGGITQRLALGSDDVHGQGVYALVDDVQTAYVVPKTLLEALDHEPGHYRNKELFGWLVTAWGRKLSIAAGANHTELEKRDGRWWVTGSGETYADPKAVERLLSALDDVRATRFLEGAEAESARASLSKPQRTVQLRIVPDEGREDKTPEFVELRIAGACPGHEKEHVASAGAAGTPVCVADETLNVFETSADALRQATAIAAAPSEIERFEMTVGNSKVTAKREGEKWLDAAGKPVDREAVEQWLEDLSIERALSFPTLAPLEERMRLTVYLADDKRQTIVLGAVTPDGKVLARRDQEPTLVVFRSGLSDLLAPTARRFASLQLWTHQPSEVQAFEAQSRVLHRKLQLIDGGFRTGPSAPEVSDGLRVRELLRELMRLRALSFVTERARPEHGFESPSARLTLTLVPAQGKAHTLTLVLGASTLKGAYARVDDGAVYDVPREVVNLLDELAGAAPTLLPAQPEAAEDEALGEHEGDDHAAHDHGPEH